MVGCAWCTAGQHMRGMIGMNAPAVDAGWRSQFAPSAWLFVRLVLGIEWLRAGWEKVGVAGWTAPPQGDAVTGFLNGAIAKATAPGRPEVERWFQRATEQFFLPNAEPIAYLVTYGELLVGAALIIGLLTRVSAAFGVAMNLAFVFAGTTSTNPQLLLLGLAIVLVGRDAGRYGVDAWVLPWLQRLAGEPLTASARAGMLGAGVVFAAWLAWIAADTVTWLAMLVIAAAVAAAVRYLQRGVPRATTGRPVASGQLRPR